MEGEDPDVTLVYKDGVETTFTATNGAECNGDIAYVDGIRHTGVDRMIVTF